MKKTLPEPPSYLNIGVQQTEIVVAKPFSQHRTQLMHAGAALALGASMIVGFPNAASATPINEVESNDTYDTSQEINFQLDSAVSGSLSPAYEVEGEGGGWDYGDVDFFKFMGLTPGASFSAETVDSNFYEGSAILGWFSSYGTLLQVDNELFGAVDPTGEIILGVSGLDDPSFSGYHGTGGDYTLMVTEVTTPATPVPEPGTASLLLFGLTGLAAFFRKLKK